MLFSWLVLLLSPLFSLHQPRNIRTSRGEWWGIRSIALSFIPLFPRPSLNPSSEHFLFLAFLEWSFPGYLYIFLSSEIFHSSLLFLPNLSCPAKTPNICAPSPTWPTMWPEYAFSLTALVDSATWDTRCFVPLFAVFLLLDHPNLIRPLCRNPIQFKCHHSTKPS